MAIISQSHNFVFVHVPKAAGTSVTSALSRYTNFCDLEIGGTAFGEAIQPAYRQRFGLGKHSTAAEIRSVMGQVAWSKAFTFGFVRNPFDRCISTFHFLRNWSGVNEAVSDRIKSFADFDEYVLSGFWDKTPGPDFIFLPQLHWLQTSRASPVILVDYVGRVERLDADLHRIRATLGLRELEDSPSAPVLNASTRDDSGAYFSNPTVVDRIVVKYREDFEKFGYSEDPNDLGLNVL